MPPSLPMLNAPPLAGWAGGVLTSFGAQSSLPEGSLLCTFSPHRSLGQALSSSGSGLVRGPWVWPGAASLHHHSSFAQRDQRHFTESQNGRGWKGPLWVTQSNPPAEAGSPTAGCRGPCPGGS